jgi:organic radical activating enzyme
MVVLKQTLDDLCLNILLTSVCNAGCSFCIADEFMQSKNTSKMMSEENFSTILSMLKKEKVYQVNLLGGEPSKHPRSLEFGKKISLLDIPVGFSTNGLWDESFREKIEEIEFPIEFELTYLGDKFYSEKQKKKLKQTFQSLRDHNVSLGLIVSSVNDEYLEHIELCREYNFELRWALLEPTQKTGLQPHYSSIEYLKELGSHIANIVEYANSKGIDTWADLTVPKCTINENKMYLFDGENNDIQFKCPPFFDITPDLNIWRCLPLAHNNTSYLTDHNSFREAYKSLELLKSEHTKKGLFEECTRCDYFLTECSGGPAIAKELKNEF